MSKTINIGDRVSLIDENVRGTVLSIDNNEVLIIDSDGFERLCQINELIVYDTNLALDSMRNTKLPKKTNPPRKKKVTNTNVVDLHSKNKFLNQNEILSHQLVVFKTQLNAAIRAHKPSIIFIHGEGAGILRKNIHQILTKNQISYGDGPYHEFGYGAIEVYLTGIRKLIK